MSSCYISNLTDYGLTSTKGLTEEGSWPLRSPGNGHQPNIQTDFKHIDIYKCILLANHSYLKKVVFFILYDHLLHN